MALNTPVEGEILLLQYMLGVTAQSNVRLHLYSSPTSAPDDTWSIGMAGLTESSAAGYASVTLTSSGWTVSVSGNDVTAAFSQITFAFTTSATLYGYYVTSNDNGTMLWAEKFSGAPFTIPTTGGNIAVTPKISAD